MCGHRRSLRVPPPSSTSTARHRTKRKEKEKKVLAGSGGLHLLRLLHIPAPTRQGSRRRWSFHPQQTPPRIESCCLCETESEKVKRHKRSVEYIALHLPLVPGPPSFQTLTYHPPNPNPSPSSAVSARRSLAHFPSPLSSLVSNASSVHPPPFPPHPPTSYRDRVQLFRIGNALQTLFRTTVGTADSFPQPHHRSIVLASSSIPPRLALPPSPSPTWATQTGNP